MWPQACSPCWIINNLTDLPVDTRPYYEPAHRSGWILRDILDHVMSINTLEPLQPAYQIRQYSHRRASFLRRPLMPPAEIALLPRYPERDYRGCKDADALHTDLLYSPEGLMYPEFRQFWLSDWYLSPLLAA
jgi:hypothetical protein